MTLSLEEVRHVAMLCRLALTPAEEERMQGQLSSILEHVNRLQEVDTASVAPTSSGLDLHNVQRADIARPSWPVEAILANAPDRSGDLFRVRAILEEG
jgi:aspartyl-tRNA(Asn)/glutamyl-tRNA(Gln) amidotransferase subunit C